MITRDDIRELASFQPQGQESCTLSFYYQPTTPQNRAHRAEAILVKDLVRNAQREAEKHGKNGCARADLERILEMITGLSAGHAKAVFACSSHNFWREFELPPLLSSTQLFVNQRFHLKPLAALLGAQPRICVAVINRQRARLFDFRLEELRDKHDIVHSAPRRSKSDGFGGYDAGHAERRVADDAMRHFKDVAERLKSEAEANAWDRIIIGCQENHWSELEPHLHPYVKQRLLGRFSADATTATNEQIREEASRIFKDSIESRRHLLVGNVISEAKSNSRGVTGLRRVLRSLELGEVQTLLIGDNFKARAVECASCGHLDSHLVSHCPACGHATRELEDVCDPIIRNAILRDIELLYVKDEPAFDQVGNIAALLRFRADQRKGTVAVA
ncbi:MAG TPA: host attachment protein [Terriglobales bacterium]|nr:host attachment protein [Terriglobales bacterium]